jgi:hypothetical protein
MNFFVTPVARLVVIGSAIRLATLALSPPEGNGASTRLRLPPLPPPTPSVIAASRGRQAKPQRYRRQRPTFCPRLGERVRALLIPGGGAPQKTMVRRGWEAVVRWRLVMARGAGRHAAVVANDGCLAQI